MDDAGTQRLNDDQAGTWLPLAAAAAQMGVSVKTARRRLKLGELVSRQVPTAHGQAYEVWVPTLARVDGLTTQRVDDVTTLELVRLVDRLQRENRDLAGLVGSLQERVTVLQAALPAPSEPAPGSPSANATVETSASTSSRARAWWRLW